MPPHMCPLSSAEFPVHVDIPHPALSTAAIVVHMCPSPKYYTMVDLDCNLDVDVTTIIRAPPLLEEVLATSTKAP